MVLSVSKQVGKDQYEAILERKRQEKRRIWNMSDKQIAQKEASFFPVA
jgi:hypothetical protein